MTDPAAPLDVSELARRLRLADPASLLVPPRLLRRVIKHTRNLIGLGLQVPHRKCYVVARDIMLGRASPEDLGVALGRELPATVVLLPLPDATRLAQSAPGPVLVRYWRLLFHTAVHRAVGARQLSSAHVRDRVRRIGQAAFDEIRSVLRQDKLLLPPRDDATVYEEFAALYLELEYFAPTLLPHYFPAIEDYKAIDRLLAEDVDAPALFLATRPQGAPEPTVVVDTPDRPSDPAADAVSTGGPRNVARIESQVFTKLAERASAAGNAVRAALRYTEAARTAPSKDVAAARAAADAELDRLVKRLRPALELTGAEAAAWRPALRPLLPPAARGLWPVEARLLYDLQKVCVDHERPVSAPHPAEWVYSRFTKPFVRPLPDQPLVLAVKHLRRAVDRLPAARLAEVDRHNLAELVDAALHRAETKLRARFRPRIVEALDTVGLRPADYPERVARDKLVEELLDRVTDHGFLSQGDLRDALSRNQLKLPDLSGRRELFAGDQLLRANAELADRMPGVYRRGEIYLRWLQRLSAATFGTERGRWLTWNVLLPFGGAFLAIEGPCQIAHELGKVSRFLLRLIGLAGPPSDHGLHHAAFPLAPWPVILLGGVFAWLLLHVPAVRRVAGGVAATVGRALKLLFLELPAEVLRWPVVRRLLDSPEAHFAGRYLLKPLLPAVIVAVLIADWQLGARPAVVGGALTFAAAVLFLTTRFSRDVEEVTADWAARRWQYVRDFFPGLFHLIMDVFKRALEAIDRGLYAVDEWLRFRGTEGRLTRVFKTVGGLIWGGVAYVVRFLVVLFVEPQINPIKHFPVVTISHKLLLPMVGSVAYLLENSFGIGSAGAWTLATVMIGKIPGIFGFLVWEFKENWRLYRANRPRVLRPAMVGHHGETLPRLLRPGFHSGTLPKLYAKLRRAERRALKTGDCRPARRHRTALHHVEQAIGRFAQRELLVYVNATPQWAPTPLRLVRAEAGSNRIRVAVACPAGGPGTMEVTFEERSGWLVAGASEPTWRAAAMPAQRAVLDLALTGFEKVSGVDLLRADVALTFGDVPYDIAENGLVVWFSDGEVGYDLTTEPTAEPRVRAGKSPDDLPLPAADDLVFRRRPITWDEWVSAWQQVSTGDAKLTLSRGCEPAG